MNPALSERLEKIEREISNLLTSQPSPVRRGSLAPNAKGLPPYAYETVNGPILDLLSRGGKRWRPLVMLLCCEAVGGGEAALPYAPLPELVHNGTLAIDDIEDDSDLRRGKPALHKIFGVDATVNSGNWIYFYPLVLIENGKLPMEKKLSLYRIYGESLRRVHMGQGLDIFWHNERDLFPTKEEYLEMCRLKTGALSGCAARMGTLIGKDEKTAERSGAVWDKAGIAFQIRDDALNLSWGVSGKIQGDDVVEGKKSLPVILYAQTPERRKWISRRFSEASKEGPQRRESIKRVIEELDKEGACEEALQFSSTLLDDIRSELSEIFPAGEALSLMTAILDSFG